MPSEITHIVLAEKLADKLFDKFDRATFIIGTIFPDIRYLEVIDRTKTHFRDQKLSDVLESSNSFTAGIKYHNLVDRVVDAVMNEQNIYKLLPSSEFITQALKIYQDELLYPQISDWKEVVSYLDSVLAEEINFGVQPDQISRWHSLLQNYFSNPPTTISQKVFVLGIGFSKEAADEMTDLIEQMRKNRRIQKIITSIFKDWSSLVLN